MSNVNFYTQNPVAKQEQPVNSNYIQKILDENVSLIHTIMEKQQQHHTQESDELLKNLHKNLIYLATIADQTTSAGNQGQGITPQSPYNYSNPAALTALPSQTYHSNMPMQQSAQTIQQYAMPSQVADNEVVDKKQISSEEDNKEITPKPDFVMGSNVDMDNECEKVHAIKDVPNKLSEPDKDIPPSLPTSETVKDNINPTKPSNVPDSIHKAENETAFVQNPNANIKTDMPPPSQLPLGVHPEKNPAHYLPNQRFAYPGVNPNYGQYSSNPHFDQTSKFYPQSPYQQSPYNYQGMYNPYQPVPPSMSPGGHYNQHMMAAAPMYPQYPYYQQQQPQPGMEHLAAAPKDQAMHAPPPATGPQMKQPLPEVQPSSTNANIAD